LLFGLPQKEKEAGPTGLGRLFFGFFTVKSFFLGFSEAFAVGEGIKKSQR
jgi:hypothetical protein